MNNDKLAKVSYVLVVDDDVDLRTVLVLTLQEFGHRAVGAANGLEALKCIVAEGYAPPGLILMDLDMPVLSGWDYLKLRAAFGAKVVPTVAMTAAKALEGLPPDVEVLRKPFSVDELLDVLARHYKP